MAKKKKKKKIDVMEKFPNGMYKERTKHAVLQGGLLLVFLFGFGVLTEIVNMVPSEIAALIVLKNASMRTNFVLEIIFVLIGVTIFVFGGYLASQKTGEADALYAFQNKQEREFDKRYVLVGVAAALAAYYILASLINIRFISGPIYHLGKLFTGEVTDRNVAAKIPLGLRLIAGLICTAIPTPFVILGALKGFRNEMEKRVEEEAENAKMEAERKAREEAEEAERAAKEAEREARRAARRNGSQSDGPTDTPTDGPTDGPDGNG